MTYRDDFARARPACPSCRAPGHVERSGQPARPWYCTDCNYAFDGTHTEFERQARRRATAEAERAAWEASKSRHLPDARHQLDGDHT